MLCFTFPALVLRIFVVKGRMYKTAFKYRNIVFSRKGPGAYTIMFLFFYFVKQLKKDLRLKRIEEIVLRKNATWKICIKKGFPNKY
jgi:hypothetical protein